MNGLLLNLILALVWAAVSGDFSAQNLTIGFGLGFVILLLMRRVVGVPLYGRRALRVVGLLAFFVWELLKANLRVAAEVLHPRLTIRPGVVMIPLDVKTEAQITLLANLITLTPGTLSLDVSADRRVLYVHALSIRDPEELRRAIKQGFERRILEVWS